MNHFFEIKTNKVSPATGKILVSEPLLLDSYFNRSVVLLIDYSKEEGTAGVIINKSIEVSLNAVVKDLPKFDVPVFLGGPVQPTNLFFIHTLGDKIENSQKIMDGLYWGGSIDVVREMIALKKIDKKDIRFFAGYSGWQPSQLENELKNNNWVVVRTNARKILETKPEELWSVMVKDLGEQYSFWEKMPKDPRFN